MLHEQLLPSSPLLAMGHSFISDFYYGAMVEEGLVRGALVLEGDDPVGLVAFTEDANGFMTAAVKRRWGTLVKVLVRHPPSPRRAFEAVRLARERTHDTSQQIAEILSMGVLAAGPGHPAPRARRALGRQLVTWAVEQLEGHRVQALVDETNLPARLMYLDLGWTVEDRVEAGWPIPQLVFCSPAP